MFRKTVYGRTFKDVNFVPLQSATFCVPMRTDQYQQPAQLPSLRKPFCAQSFSSPWRISSPAADGSSHHGF
jgi:hypothetical protein